MITNYNFESIDKYKIENDSSLKNESSCSISTLQPAKLLLQIKNQGEMSCRMIEECFLSKKFEEKDLKNIEKIVLSNLSIVCKSSSDLSKHVEKTLIEKFNYTIDKVEEISKSLSVIIDSIKRYEVVVDSSGLSFKEKIDLILKAAKDFEIKEADLLVLKKILISCRVDFGNESIIYIEKSLLKHSSIKPSEYPKIKKFCKELVGICERFEKKINIIDNKKSAIDLYSKIGEVPEHIQDFNVKDEHTIPTGSYLDIRLSRTIRESIERVNKHGSNTEIFIGSDEDLKEFYQAKGYLFISTLKTKSSNAFYYFENPKDPSDAKVVISKISNESRLIHVLLQLKFSNVNLSKVQIRGAFEGFSKNNVETFSKYLNDLETKPYLAFIGNMAQVIKDLAIWLYPDQMKNLNEKEVLRKAQILLKVHDYRGGKVDGIFSFGFATVYMNGEKKGIICLTMPNGSFANNVTNLLLNRGVKQLIMVGAGGSLDAKSGVGSYQMITSSIFNNQVITIPQENTIILKDIPNLKIFQGKNITVESPLVENSTWLKNVTQQRISAVDVETYHIFKAFVDNAFQDTKFIFPGLFISDVVGVDPLEQKIGNNNAWQHLPDLIRSFFKYNKIEQGYELPKEIKLIKKSEKPVIKKEKEVVTCEGLEKQKNAYKKDVESLSMKDLFESEDFKIRIDSIKQLTSLRKELAKAIFNNIIRPEIELIMKVYKDSRQFDEAVCLYGFNRLFNREVASLGTDIDFMLVIDTDNNKMVDEIRGLINRMNQGLKQIGLEMETAKHLITDLKTYKVGLDDTRISLFTMANMFNPLNEKDNVLFITGSEKILKNDVFYLTDKQIADHYINLIKQKYPCEDINDMKNSILIKLKSDEFFRNQTIDHLQKMACSELYIGKTPYKGKETLQTIFSDMRLKKGIEKRTTPFSIKFCLNRFVDLFQSTTLPTDICEGLSKDKLKAMEELAILLSNAVCVSDSKEKTLLTVPKNSSMISLPQLEKLSLQDRSLIAALMGSVGIELKADDVNFPTHCYDGLWALAQGLYEKAVQIEGSIFKAALNNCK